MDPVFYSSQPAFRSGHDFQIQGSFTVPDVPGAETQTLTGKLYGEFLDPGPTDDGMHFSTVNRNLDIPARLAVVSEAESDPLGSDFGSVSWRRIMLGILFAIVGFAYAIRRDVDGPRAHKRGVGSRI